MPKDLLLEYDQLRKGLGFNKAKPVPYPLPNIYDNVALAARYLLPEPRFMASFLYLSGQRISEFLATRRCDITFQEHGGKEFMIINSLTEKNNEYPRRTIPIARDGAEIPLFDYCKEYLESIPQNRLLCTKSRTNCWNLLSSQVVEIECINQNKTMGKKVIQVYPHFLRHCRASHLVTFHSFDIYKLMEFFGWRSPLTPSIYAKMGWKSLGNLLIGS